METLIVFNIYFIGPFRFFGIVKKILSCYILFVPFSMVFSELTIDAAAAR